MIAKWRPFAQIVPLRTERDSGAAGVGDQGWRRTESLQIPEYSFEAKRLQNRHFDGAATPLPVLVRATVASARNAC
jgi:hypothetical protein